MVAWTPDSENRFHDQAGLARRFLAQLSDQVTTKDTTIAKLAAARRASIFGKAAFYSSLESHALFHLPAVCGYGVIRGNGAAQHVGSESR